MTTLTRADTSLLADETPDRLGPGAAVALSLHLLLVAGIVAATFLGRPQHNPWGENASSVGAIQASMVSAIPLPRAPSRSKNPCSPAKTSPPPPSLRPRRRPSRHPVPPTSSSRPRRPKR